MGTRRRSVLRIGLVLFGLAALGSGIVVGLAWHRLTSDLPDFETLSDYRPSLTSTVLDRGGEPIGEFFELRRRLTPLEEIPNLLVQAFLAAEDDTFYEHSGVDYVSIARAALANLLAGGETVQGASTITQQMVKQLLLSPERTYERKIRELILARRIEQRFSKQDILFLYLNQIYFGSGAYGVGEAALTYFGKPVSEIDASEAALLAGLPKAPGAFSPYHNPERAEERRRYVLQRMREEGYLDEDTWRDAVENPPSLQGPAYRERFADAAVVTEEVRRALVDRLGNEAVLRGGLVIETTIDLALQEKAVADLRAGLEALERRQGWRGPLRNVPEAGREAALAELERRNDLVARDPETLPTRALEGLVAEVSTKAGSARVLFAPGFEAQVSFEDLSWARPFGEEHRWKKPRSIGEVLAPGDVARFRVSKGKDGDVVATLAPHPEAEGALLSFDLDGGDLLAMVGGYDFAESEFNRSLQASRQPGSAFKPLVYTAAMGAGQTPASIVYDRPAVYEDEAAGFTWRPENYGGRFLGALTLREALARSVNNATIHLLQEIGVGRVIELAEKLGIRSPLEHNLGIALGVSPVTLLEMTRAYGVLATGGRAVEPILIRRVLDRDGNELLTSLPLDPVLRPPPEPETSADPDEGTGGAERAVEVATNAAPSPGRVDPDEQALPEGYVLPPVQAYLGQSLLRGVVEHPKGTGRRARSLGRPLGGKTGTTNDQGDAWFVGFSPDVATGVWVGFDENQVLGRGETGGHAALPIWIDFMRQALADRPRRNFPVPEGIVFARIDEKTGRLASAESESTVLQAFAEGTEPSAQAATGESSAVDERRFRLDF